jgi:hypothetical protein
MVVEIGGEGAVLPGEFEDRPTVLHKLRNEPTLSRIAKYSPRQRHVAADDLFERVGGHFCRNSTPNNGKNTIALATDAAHESGRMQKSSASEAPDPGRHHVGTPGDIISECPGDFVEIRSHCHTPFGTAAALAAKGATTTIPIVFMTSADPMQEGLVASYNRPGGNVTGLSIMNVELGAKRLGLLHQLIPKALRIAVFTLQRPRVRSAMMCTPETTSCCGASASMPA